MNSRIGTRAFRTDRALTVLVSLQPVNQHSVVWWRCGQGVELASPKVAGSTPGLALSGNNLGQVVHTRAPLSPSSIIWYRSSGGDALRLGR